MGPDIPSVEMPSVDTPDEGSSTDAAQLFSSEATESFLSGMDHDWKRVMSTRKRQPGEMDEADDGGPPDTGSRWDHDDVQFECCSRRVKLLTAAILVAIVAVSAHQLFLWFNPTPLSLSFELVRPQKFKIDVTDFWAPRISAALQIVLQVRNSNFFRALVFEGCKLTAFDENGVKLASLLHDRAMMVSPMNTVKVTMNLNGLGGALPSEEQRRLAATFLREKALLLTLVATATSRMNVKGSAAKPLAANSSRRIDLRALAKEPFFQRAPQPPPPPAEDVVHDVP
mmetsp:Transcript_46241/g.114682  ORF Transcript_46241/g.114682 Transcript_46241/m.114682 type:complete len:284 (+) Transcript_46241:19-870(+)